jgi:hypothetical protein
MMINKENKDLIDQALATIDNDTGVAHNFVMPAWENVSDKKETNEKCLLRTLLAEIYSNMDQPDQGKKWIDDNKERYPNDAQT